MLAATGAATASSSSSSPSSPILRPIVASRSITSRSRISSFRSSSRHMVIAWNVSGLSHSPAIIVLRPASMRLAIAISPSRLNNSTDPISRKYMRTGSSVRSSFSVVVAATVTSRELETSTKSVAPEGVPSPSSASSASSFSMMLMPISDNIDITSSICSELTCSGGNALFS